MFHPHEVINDTHSCYSHDSQDQSVYDVHIEPSCESLLSVLDDKNKIIATLRRQLQNQKVQLSYYLKKELSSTKIEQFSESCSPGASEESMAVNLAMANFNRKMGIKSNILSLYERMCYIDERISGSLEDQEFILRKIVNRLCEFVKHANGNVEFKVQFSNFIADPFHIELFNKLLSATIHLKKKLDTFRICCNRLIVIEDERNAIVEHIYNLPADQRLSCNYLVSMETEKMQLENELQQIIKDQRKDQERIKDLNVIEEKLSNLQFQLQSATFQNDDEDGDNVHFHSLLDVVVISLDKSRDHTDGYRISRMLQEVNSEARILLELTKQQRRKYEIKLARIRETNLNLERILVYLKLALEKGEPTPTDLIEYGVITVEDFKVFECIKKEIDTSKRKFKCKLFDELQTKEWEMEVLKDKLKQVMFERNELKITCGKLKKTISDMKFNQEMDLASLKEERDIYKKQVDDLEAIREAYAQLVSRKPNPTKIDREYLEELQDRDQKIYDLEKTNRELAKQLRAMKNTVNKQNRDIKQQANVKEDLKQHSKDLKHSEDKYLEYVYKNTNNETYESLKDIKDRRESCDTVSYVELYQQEIYVQEKVVNMVEDGRDFHLSTKPLAFALKRLDSSKENSDVRDCKRSVSCIKVISSKRGQTSDVMETIVTSTSLETELQGNVKKNSSSVFSIAESRKVAESELDEYELMKDCSRESLPRVCHSRKKFKDMHFQQRFPVIDDQMEY